MTNYLRHFSGRTAQTAVVSGLLSLIHLMVAAKPSKAEYSPPFELIDWHLTLPTDKNNDGKADRVSEKELASGWQNSNFFFLSEDGGMTFRCPIKGAKTSKNTKFARTELREMLRRGNTSISTAEPGRNNWVLSTAHKKYRKRSGGVDGELHATLTVDHVTTTGAQHEVGRVIIGQIHGRDDEPVRLYYRKLPHNERGSLYFAHEVKGQKEDLYFPLLGDRSHKASDPVDGIALNEKFSYSIVSVGDKIEVSISKNDKLLARKRIDVSQSGYDASDEYLYFKAGVYNQNKTGDADDYVQATFYELRNLHGRP